jgi:hypothetical protein
MARVTGPLFSMSASGTIGKAITFGSWKGRPWARKWFTPENPQTATQVNVRTALTIAVAVWQDSLSQAQKDALDGAASGLGMSGYNYFMRHAMDEYVDQLGTSTTPVSLVYSGTYPSDTYTWSAT